MTLVAAIDCGTNTVRLLIADAGTGGQGGLREVLRRSTIVRLGQGVDATGRLAPEALERTRVALASYAGELAAAGVDPGRVRFVATSATRDAANGGEFLDLVRATLGPGIEPEVVTGETEAGLAFAGATRELLGGPLPPPYLVVDIGGGSTELVLGGSGDGAGTVRAARSVDVGSVRLTERHLHADPPTAGQVAAAVVDVHAALDLVEQRVPVAEAATVVVVAGTATTVTALALGLPAYDRAAVHLARLTRGDVDAVTDRLLTLTRADIAALPAVEPARADVLGAGALILRTVLERVGADGCAASDHDILDGIAQSVAARGVADRGQR